MWIACKDKMPSHRGMVLTLGPRQELGLHYRVRYGDKDEWCWNGMVLANGGVITHWAEPTPLPSQEK